MMVNRGIVPNWPHDSQDSLSCMSTLWSTNIAIENGDLEWICSLNMVIFHSYVSLPEGSWMISWMTSGLNMDDEWMK